MSGHVVCSRNDHSIRFHYASHSSSVPTSDRHTPSVFTMSQLHSTSPEHRHTIEKNYARHATPHPTMKHTKKKWLRSPMQLPSHGQWWSNPRTQQSQLRQWNARGGMYRWHDRHRFSVICASEQHGRATIASFSMQMKLKSFWCCGETRCARLASTESPFKSMELPLSGTARLKGRPGVSALSPCDAGEGVEVLYELCVDTPEVDDARRTISLEDGRKEEAGRASLKYAAGTSKGDCGESIVRKGLVGRAVTGVRRVLTWNEGFTKRAEFSSCSERLSSVTVRYSVDVRSSR